jgi:ribonuclease P protein component
MLPKNNRLRQKKDIDNVFKKGKGLKEDFLILKTVKNGLGKARFGFIVSQKISKKSTLRNKIKRKLREAVRLKFKTINAGTDNLFIAVPGIEKKDFREIEKTIAALLKKANIVKCFKDD